MLPYIIAVVVLILSIRNILLMNKLGDGRPINSITDLFFWCLSWFVNSGVVYFFMYSIFG